MGNARPDKRGGGFAWADRINGLNISMKRQLYRHDPVNLEEAVDLLLEEKKSRLLKMLTPELLSSKKKSGVGHDYHANIRINQTAPQDFTVAHGPNLNPGRKMVFDPVTKRRVLRTVGRPGQSNLSVIGPGAQFGPDPRRGTGDFYKYDNVLEIKKDASGKLVAEPKKKAYDTLLEMLTKLNISDARLLDEDAYTPDELKTYLDNIFKLLIDWFDEAVDKDKQNPGGDFSHYADPSDESMRNFKAEEEKSRMKVFEDKQNEFLGKINSAKDLYDVALTLQPVVEFQKRLDSVKKEVNGAQQNGTIPFVIEQDGDYQGRNPAMIFFQDPDAIFVEAAGVWEKDENARTPENRGFSRRVDRSAVDDAQAWIVLTMPKHKDWKASDQVDAEDKWIASKGLSRSSMSMLDRSKARHEGTRHIHTGGYIKKPYWCDVRFTKRFDGGTDFFDQLIKKYSKAGSQASDVPVDGQQTPDSAGPIDVAAPDNGVSVQHQRDVDLYTADTQKMVEAAIEVCNDYGITARQIGIPGKVLAKLDADDESGTYGIRVNQSQPYNIKMFATIIARLADVVLHGQMKNFSNWRVDTSDDTMKEVESHLVAGMVLYNCGYKDVANDFLHRATEDFQYITYGSPSDDNARNKLVDTCRRVSSVVNEITKAVEAKIKAFGDEAQDDEQPEE